MPLTTSRKPIKLVETGFDTLYLSAVLLCALLLLLGSNAGSDRWQFGLMALILGTGDAFHLVPRIGAMWSKEPARYTALLGIGKLIASITMTVFYVVLWHVGVKHYAHVFPGYMTIVVLVLAAMRIVLCLLPQNCWVSEAPPLKWAIWRNIPFFVLGMLAAALFAVGRLEGDAAFSYLWIAVLLSFACYLPVVLFASRYPKVGMLMLPKSSFYVAIVLVGFSLSGA